MNFIKKTIYLFLGASMLLSAQSCSDWNDVTPKNPNYELSKDKNPEEYKKYIENLNEYKQSEHKVIYSWFDNSDKEASRRPLHINNLPDSIDVIVLTSPDNLVERELQEIEEVRAKGTKVIYSVNLDKIKSDYKAHLEEIEENITADGSQPEIIDRTEYITSNLQQLLRLTKKYNYDGVCLGYTGKSTLHMYEPEKVQYLADEAIFLTFVESWLSGNQDKLLVFQGQPQNLVNNDILEHCKHIIVNTENVTNTSQIVYSFTTASGANVPTDRFIAAVNTPSSNPEEAKLGRWADNSLAITSTAIWATGHHDFTVQGIAILGIQRDYYSQPKIYVNSREAINILNPSLK